MITATEISNLLHTSKPQKSTGGAPWGAAWNSPILTAPRNGIAYRLFVVIGQVSTTGVYSSMKVVMRANYNGAGFAQINHCQRDLLSTASQLGDRQEVVLGGIQAISAGETMQWNAEVIASSNFIAPSEITLGEPFAHFMLPGFAETQNLWS